MPRKRLFCQGNDTRTGRRHACLLYPSHGRLRFITSHSRFALASTMRKTKRLRRRLTWRSSVHHSKMHLSAIMVWILEYFFFAKFTVLTWFANHSVIRLRKVAFFGAKKPLVFFHLPAVWLPRIPDNCFLTSLSYFSVGRMTHSAQTMFGFSSTWMRSCTGKLCRLFTTLGFVMCTVSGSIERIERCIGTGLFTQLTVSLFSLLTKVLLLAGLSTQTSGGKLNLNL